MFGNFTFFFSGNRDNNKSARLRQRTGGNDCYPLTAMLVRIAISR